MRSWQPTSSRRRSGRSAGLVTYDTVFVIELHSRRVSIAGSTPHPDDAFMLQIVRQLTDASEGALNGPRVLICDRNQKWSTAVRQLLEASGVRVVRTPFRAPNCNAHAERFVRSIKEECLDRLIPLGEGHFRRTLAEFAVHYHGERNHQGLGNELIEPLLLQKASGDSERSSRTLRGIAARSHDRHVRDPAAMAPSTRRA
jgi:transposase InsO family protein